MPHLLHLDSSADPEALAFQGHHRHLRRRLARARRGLLGQLPGPAPRPAAAPGRRGAALAAAAAAGRRRAAGRGRGAAAGADRGADRGRRAADRRAAVQLLAAVEPEGVDRPHPRTRGHRAVRRPHPAAGRTPGGDRERAGRVLRRAYPDRGLGPRRARCSSSSSAPRSA